MTLYNNSNLSVPSTNEITFGSLLKIDTQSSLPTITSTGAGAVLLVDAVPLLLDNTIRFEGSSIDTNDTTLMLLTLLLIEQYHYQIYQVMLF